MSVAAEAGPVPASAPQLSTDYLNRYGEALMLIEMSSMDPGILQDLQGWRAIGYVEHFETSLLRCKVSALMAYGALDPASREAFEALCGSMNRLVATATALLVELSPEHDPAPIVEVASEAMRRLIVRANHFINANGNVELASFAGRELQDEIDALFD